MTQPQLSIVIPTYNRAGGISKAVESALRQTASPSSYEVIVVDNNSTDNTAEVLERMIRDHPGRMRRVLETRQGVAYARQAGIDFARADTIGFFDDDVRVSSTWVATIQRIVREHAAIDCFGGKVLPEWSSPRPQWLTSSHWAPLALQDFGDEPMVVSLDNPRGLISANLICRKAVFDRLGGFSPEFQRVKDGIGSLEDDEWIRRFWKSGGRALYVPELVATTDVPSSRMTRAYHRRWHRGHGRFYARLRADEFERTSRGVAFGVPAHVYRSALRHGVAWLRSLAAGRGDQAFEHEVQLRFLAGFLAERLRELRRPALVEVK